MARFLPRQDVPIAESGGRTSTPFYVFLQEIEQSLQGGATSEDLTAQVAAIATALGSPDGTIANIPAPADAGLIIGQGSIRTLGTMGDGKVFVTLLGDAEAPGNTYAYGTGADGAKGWVAISDALAATANLTLTVGTDGVTTFDLADLADAGGGAIRKFDRDTKGRVSGTSDATTTDLTEGDNLYFTEARISYTQSGTGAVLRPTTEKALEQPSPQDYDAAGDGVTDDTTPLANAIAASPDLQLDGDYLVTAHSNIYGVPLNGEGRILTAVTGGLRQLNSRVDESQHMFGQEYLYAFHTKLMAGTTASMVFSGDSTTEGGGTQATTPWLVNEVVLRLGKQRGHKLTAVNAGHSNKTTAQWVSDYLTADLATAPDLYVVRWGINDPANGRDLEDFTTSLRAGLEQCRATYGVDQMAIVLMVPNNTNDTPNGRDQKWYEQIRKVIRQAARDYLCACIDTYAIWHDANNGAGLWMDHVYGDGRSLHPKNVLNGSITSAMANFLFPAAFDLPLSGTYVPTVTASTNCTSAAPQGSLQWLRSGSVVTVSGVFVVTPATASGLVLFRASLPLLPDNFTANAQCVGAANVAYTPYASGIVIAQTGTGNAQMGLFSQGTTSVGFYVTFTYRLS